MRRLGFLLLALSVSAATWAAAKKFTAEDLKQMLATLQQANKSDIEIATRLKEVELAEQLTPATRDSLRQFSPGPQTTEQLEILQGRTATLLPPASEIPNIPAPDIAAQKAILAKAVDYVTRVYMQNPHFVVSRSTVRYQDGVDGIRTNSGMTNNMPNVGRSWEQPNMFMRLIGSHTDAVEIDKGVFLIGPVKQKQPWGQNGQISEGGPGPVLSMMLQEAAANGALNWRRWQLLNGRPAAVFSFSVPRKKSHYEVHYCCFPVTEDTGRMGYEGTGSNLQYSTTWKDFKTTVGYHGEFYIDADAGTIVRVVTQAELKPTDFVHQEDMRIDYGPVPVEDKTYILPVESYTLNEVVPNGDNYGARYSVRHTLFHETYAEYRTAPAK